MTRRGHRTVPSRDVHVAGIEQDGGENRPTAGSKDRAVEELKMDRRTYSPKPNEVERSWYIVDAEGKTLGRLAGIVATMLRGKPQAAVRSSRRCR